MAVTYTEELRQDILERLEMQAVMCNATPDTPPAINILEALALLTEINRLKAENAKAWDDGYKHGQLSGIRTGRTGHVHPYKNPYKEER